MKIKPRKILLRTAFMLTVAIAGLTVGPFASPAARAASPSLSLTGLGGSVLVNGSGFTYGVLVRLVLLNSSLTQDLGIQYIMPYPNGTIQALLVENASYSGGVAIFADQSGLPTTAAQVTIYPAPYITAQRGVGDIFVQGSGFAPGSSTTVEVFQRYPCGSGWPPRFCTKVLAVRSIPVSSFGMLNSYGNQLFSIPSGQCVLVEASGPSIVTNATTHSNIVSVCAA